MRKIIGTRIGLVVRRDLPELGSIVIEHANNKTHFDFKTHLKKVKTYNQKSKVKRTFACAPIVKSTLKKLLKARAEVLKDIQGYFKKADLSVHQVSSKEFPRLVAGLCGVQSESEVRMDFEIAKILQKHGIIFIGSDRNARAGNKSILYNGEMSHWPQDYLELGHFIKLPFLHHKVSLNGIDVGNMVKMARVNDFSRPYKSGVEFAGLGQVHRNDQFQDAILLALALGGTPTLMLTVNEGGNALVGNKPEGGHYVLIGKDSVEPSRYIIGRERALALKGKGAPLTDEELKLCYALDYGVDPKDVHFVEQPGDFHLDMAMTIVGPKTVILNDALKAAALINDYFYQVYMSKLLQKDKTPSQNELRHITRQFMKKMRQMKAIAKRRKQFEDAAEKDLKAQGFKVIRVGGVLSNPLNGYKMNFFNMIQATTPGGKRLVVAGGFEDPFFQKKFESIFSEHKINIDNFEYISFGETLKSLQELGGPMCRFKGLSWLPGSPKDDF